MAANTVRNPAVAAVNSGRPALCDVNVPVRWLLFLLLSACHFRWAKARIRFGVCHTIFVGHPIVPSEPNLEDAMVEIIKTDLSVKLQYKMNLILNYFTK
jgi:hypothetical protein